MHRCLAPLPQRPTAGELLDDPFFLRKAEKVTSQKKLDSAAVEAATASPLVLEPPKPQHRTSLSSDDDPGAICKVCDPPSKHFEPKPTLHASVFKCNGHLAQHVEQIASGSGGLA